MKGRSCAQCRRPTGDGLGFTWQSTGMAREFGPGRSETGPSGTWSEPHPAPLEQRLLSGPPPAHTTNTRGNHSGNHCSSPPASPWKMPPHSSPLARQDDGSPTGPNGPEGVCQSSPTRVMGLRDMGALFHVELRCMRVTQVCDTHIENAPTGNMWHPGPVPVCQMPWRWPRTTFPGRAATHVRRDSSLPSAAAETQTSAGSGWCDCHLVKSPDSPVLVPELGRRHPGDSCSVTPTSRHSQPGCRGAPRGLPKRRSQQEQVGAHCGALLVVLLPELHRPDVRGDEDDTPEKRAQGRGEGGRGHRLKEKQGGVWGFRVKAQRFLLVLLLNTLEDSGSFTSKPFSCQAKKGGRDPALPPRPCLRL